MPEDDRRMYDKLRDEQPNQGFVDEISRIYRDCEATGEIPYEEMEKFLGQPNFGVTVGGDDTAAQHFSLGSDAR